MYGQKLVSNLAVGLDYELYVGHLLEQQGYAVLYCGILFGKADRCVDLIGIRTTEVVIAQCKWRSRDNIGSEDVEYFWERANRFADVFKFEGKLVPQYYTNTNYQRDAIIYMRNKKIEFDICEMPEGYKGMLPAEKPTDYEGYVQNAIDAVQKRKDVILRGMQLEVYNFPFHGHNVLAGVAGSGKTLCAVKRAQYIHEKTSEQVLILSYTNALVAYIRQFLGQSDKIVVTTYHKFAIQYLRNAGVIEHDSIISSQDKQNLLLKSLDKFVLSNKINDALQKFLLAEIEWIQGYGVESKEQYLTIERVGRGKGAIPISRNDVYEIYLDYLRERGKRGYTCDFTDMAAYFYRHLKQGNSNGFRHIILDEAQDFTRMGIQSLVAFLPQDGSLLYIGDLGQQIYGQGRMSWKSMGMSIRKVFQLKETYRNTKSIADFANCIRAKIELEEDDVLKANCDGLLGEKPVLIQCDSDESEIEYVIKQTRKSKEVGSVCIVTSMKNMLDRLQAQIAAKGISSTIIDRDVKQIDTKKGVYLATYHSVKGLEFDTILIYHCTNDAFSWIVKGNTEDVYLNKVSTLLYTAITRARKTLGITYSGKMLETLTLYSDMYNTFNYSVKG